MLTQDQVRATLSTRYQEKDVDEFMQHLADQTELADALVAIIRFIRLVASVSREIEEEEEKDEK